MSIKPTIDRTTTPDYTPLFGGKYSARIMRASATTVTARIRDKAGHHVATVFGIPIDLDGEYGMPAGSTDDPDTIAAVESAYRLHHSYKES